MIRPNFGGMASAVGRSYNPPTAPTGSEYVSAFGKSPAAYTQAAAPQAPSDFQSRWYHFADQIPTIQANQQLAAQTAKTNAGLNSGLSSLGFRGNNNYGSMERLAGAGMGAQASTGNQVAQSKYNKLAELYGQGLQQVDLPTMQGKDMQAAINNASKEGDILGNFFRNLGL